MKSMPAGRLFNLFPTAKTIGDDQSIFCRGPDGREENPFPYLHGDLIMLTPLKTKDAGHATAAGIENLIVKAQFGKHTRFCIHVHDRFMMAVSLDERFAPQPRGLIAASF